MTAPKTLAVGEKQTITGTFWWDDPIAAETGGVLEFVDATIIENITQAKE